MRHRRDMLHCSPIYLQLESGNTSSKNFHGPGEYENYCVKLNERFYAGEISLLS